MSTTIVQEVEHAKVHPTSQAGFGKGKAEQYDAVRPSYAPEVLSHIRKALTGKDNLNIVEIASGTGIFTRALLAHPEWESSVTEMKCVEPNEGMRDVFSRTVNDPRISLATGTFDDTGVTDGWADLIVIATAFHWCLDREAAIKEFIRILKPDGVVCFLWIREDRSAAPWIGQVYDVLLPKHKALADRGSDHFAWRDLLDLPAYKENFTSSEDRTINYVGRSNLESFTARCLTWSGITLLSDEEKEDIKRQIKEIVGQGEGLVWIDKENGIFGIPYSYPVVIFRRISGAGKDETKQA